MSSNSQIIFITGTDTGIGKTLLSSLLFANLREKGEHVMAVKPFCSGGRQDGELFDALQEGECYLDDINPFYYNEPVSPLVAARACGKRCDIADVARWFQKTEDHLKRMSDIASVFEILDQGDKGQNPVIPSRIPTLLVEGAGGLLSPLGEGFNLLTFMREMNAGDNLERKVSAIVAAANRLGTINHALLSVRTLQDSGITNIAVVLNDISSPAQRTPDMESNFNVLTELLDPVQVFELPHLTGSLNSVDELRRLSRMHEPVLSNIIRSLSR